MSSRCRIPRRRRRASNYDAPLMGARRIPRFIDTGPPCALCGDPTVECLADGRAAVLCTSCERVVEVAHG